MKIKKANKKNVLGNSKIGTPFCCRKSRDQFHCSGDFSRYLFSSKEKTEKKFVVERAKIDYCEAGLT